MTATPDAVASKNKMEPTGEQQGFVYRRTTR